MDLGGLVLPILLANDKLVTLKANLTGLLN